MPGEKVDDYRNFLPQAESFRYLFLVFLHTLTFRPETRSDSADIELFPSDNTTVAH